MPNINAPIQFFADRDGNPLESGFVYIGVVGQNPETTPIPVYWDSALTQPAAQPLRTASGMIYRNGSPSQVYVTTAYSITVRDKNGGLVYTFLDSGEFDAALILRADLANNSDVAKGDALIGVRQPLPDAVGRTVHDKLTEVVSVKDFGAVGDNVTDDTLAIQKALNAVSANGGVVFVPPGIYRITSQLTITSGYVSLHGASPAWWLSFGGSTIRQDTPNIGIISIRGADPAHQINSNSIRDLTLCHGTSALDDTNTSGTGIAIANTVRTTIDNCIITGMQIGIECDFVIDMVCTRTKIHRIFSVPAGNAYGIYLRDDGTHFNASNTFRDMIISGSTTRTGTFTGIYYGGAGLNDQFFENCEIDFCETGISLNVTTPSLQCDNKIHKCVIDNYAVNGIYLSGFTTYGGVDIIGGWVAPAAALTAVVSAIRIHNSTGIKVLGVELVGISNVTNANAIGIYLTSSSDCQLVANRIRDFATHIVASTVTNSVFVGNSLTQTSGTAATTLLEFGGTSSNNTIVGNVLNASSSAGRGVLFASTCYGNLVKENILSGTFSTATLTDSARSVAIADALNSNLSVPVNTSFAEFTGGGASAQIGGIIAGYDGQELTIVNRTGTAFSIIGESASSSAANRIFTPGLASSTVANLGARSFRYSGSQSRWLMIGAL